MLGTGGVVVRGRLRVLAGGGLVPRGRSCCCFETTRIGGEMTSNG